MINDIAVWVPDLEGALAVLRRDAPSMTCILVISCIESQHGHIAGKKEYFDEVVKIGNEYDKPIYVLTACHPEDPSNFDINDHFYRNVKFVYWTDFWGPFTLHRLVQPMMLESNIPLGYDVMDMEYGKNNTLSLPFICLNKARKSHRALMLDMLSKHDILYKGAVTWRSIPKCKEEYAYITYYGFQYWIEEPLFLDQTSSDKLFQQEILPAEYANSFMQIVTESQDHTFFASEKTWIPLFFNKPFLVAGCSDFHKKLNDMGFELYDEIFDYSFDNVTSIKKRYDMIAYEVSKFVDKPAEELEALYAKVFEKCVRNKKRAIEMSCNTKSFPQIWTDLVDQHIRLTTNDHHTIFSRGINEHLNGLYDKFRF